MWGGGGVCRAGEGGGVDAKRGMRGTLRDGHSGFIITLLHLVSHHRDEREGFDCTFYARFTGEDDEARSSDHTTYGWKPSSKTFSRLKRIQLNDLCTCGHFKSRANPETPTNAAADPQWVAHRQSDCNSGQT